MIDTHNALETMVAPAGAAAFVGSWRVTIYETDGPPTRGMMTIHPDGTLIAAEHPVVTPPGAPGVIFTSSGHGAWQPTGANDAAFTFMTMGSDASGNLFAVVTISGAATAGDEPDAIAGRCSARLEDRAGNHLATFPLTFTGERIRAVPGS
jgi:hypothetical protein